MDTWDARTYDRFAGERSRPLSDLLARVRTAAPRVVVDLGCGSGNGLSLMRRRWPEASLLGVDSSVDMLRAAAVEVGADEHVSLIEADARSWSPDSPVDVVVCNALLQWIPEYADVVTRMLGWLASGGELALQVPGNFSAASHLLLRQLAESPQWTDALSRILRGPESVLSPAGYFDVLSGSGARDIAVDAWETTYLHVLSGPDPVLRWTTGTALRPVLAELSDQDRAEFSRQYGELLRAAYPADGAGRVLFPFRRIFAVARKTSPLPTEC